jgi:hypothetical protein
MLGVTGVGRGAGCGITGGLRTRLREGLALATVVLACSGVLLWAASVGRLSSVEFLRPRAAVMPRWLGTAGTALSGVGGASLGLMGSFVALAFALVFALVRGLKICTTTWLITRCTGQYS